MYIPLSTNLKKGILLTFLIGLTFLLSSCGGSSSEDNPGGPAGAGAGPGLFITDDLSNDYPQVIATIYKVEFENRSDGSLITVFEDTQGITYDLSELNGILAKLSSSIPAGSYNRAFITLNHKIILVDNTTMTPITRNPSLVGNCNAGQCVIEVAGQFDVVNGQSVILDFDLKQFTYDPAANTVTATVILDADGSSHYGYPEIRDDNYDLKGIISSIAPDSNSFDITVIKAEHFIPGSNIITVSVNTSTWYTCDGDDNKGTSCTISGISDLQTGMKVEIHGTPNGAQFDASKVAVDEDGDINIITGACTVPSRSIVDFSSLIVQREIELRGNPSYTFDQNNYSITVAGRTILLTIETRIKQESGESEQIICADRMPLSAYKMEVKYYQGLDSLNNQVYIAYKVDFNI